MSSVLPRASLNAQLGEIQQKLKSTDSDIRNQTLLDLHKDLLKSTDIKASSSRRVETTYTDEVTEATLVALVLGRIVTDKNEEEVAEVKNAAISCIGVMSRQARSPQLKKIVDTLLSGLTSPSDEQRDVACLALKAVASEIPPQMSNITPIIETLLSKIFAVLTKTSPAPESQLASELLSIINDIFTRLTRITSYSPPIQSASLSSLIQILTGTRTSVRKRCIPALSSLVATNLSLFDSQLKEKLLAGVRDSGEDGKTWVSVLANLARGPGVVKIAEGLRQDGLVDQVLSQTEDPEENEKVEGALTALEVLVLRCPTEVGPSVPRVMQRSLELVKYDPNYVDLDDDDDDVDMNGDNDDDDDDYEEEAYSDDEDVSWKIRRSAAKLLAAIVETRSDLLSDFYGTLVPTLISRFSEREESVRLEVLAAFEALLKQTIAVKAAETSSGARNKRKRSQGMDEDPVADDSVTTYLQNCLPQLLRAILKQLSSKSTSTRQECFVLLKQITEALDGGLNSESSAICSGAVSALRSVDSATTSSLSIAALTFLTSFFQHHSSRVYGSHLKELVPALVRCMKDKLQRINFEAFAAASALSQSLRPIGSSSPLLNNYSEPVQQLFIATTEVLADTTADGEVRERALSTLGNILVNEGDALGKSLPTCLPLITARLSTENSANTAVQVIGDIARSPLCKGSAIDQWLVEVLPEVVTTLRRNRRASGRNLEFAAIQNILTRIGSSLSPKAAQNFITELTPFNETPQALTTVATILASQPSSRASTDEQWLPFIYTSIKSPSSSSQLIDAICVFFGSYIDGDVDSATRVVPALLENLGQDGNIPDATQGGTSMYSNTARCIGTIVAHSQRNEAGILATFQKTIKSPKATEADLYLALLCCGEIGRESDLSTQGDLFEKILSYFDNESEEVRSAAAFAAGNLAVEASDTFLPLLLKHINNATTENARVLLLHSLKEVILHSKPSKLEVLADQLWKPLFSESLTKKSSSSKPKSGSASQEIGDDGERNVKAACIGKLTIAAPSRFLPQLQELLRSNAQNRALVAAAIRYTFIDTSSSYDEMIAPMLTDFLSLMQDENLIVRRLSLASFNAAVQNKPHLIMDRLGALQPMLYAETVVRPELQREVMMGPFKMVEDDGLENRKTAYEAMYTLLNTCFAKVNIPECLNRILAALKDVNEVKVLGLMLLLRLGQLSPSSVIPRLDEVGEMMKVIMKDVEVNAETVKQDLERKQEMQRATLRTAVPLYRMTTPTQSPGFCSFVGGLLASQEWKEFRDTTV